MANSGQSATRPDQADNILSDIKLFQFEGGHVSELPGTGMQVEKSLQRLFEANLETLLGVRFLATEHTTGPAHGGRIDTLGLDEDDCPVIIEYKRSINENVINQGLFYLDWLLDHRKEFQWLVMETLGAEVAKKVDFAAPRLLCVAGDFTRYDQHAVKQIARNIELIRYRQFGVGMLMLELVHAPKQAKITAPSAVNGASASADSNAAPEADVGADPYFTYRLAYRLSQASPALRDLHDATREFLAGLGDDVQVKELKLYTAFKRIKNFACLEVYPQASVVTVFLKLDPTSVQLEQGFTRDMTDIGHYGTGDLQVSIRSMADLEKGQPLFRRAYEGS